MREVIRQTVIAHLKEQPWILHWILNESNFFRNIDTNITFTVIFTTNHLRVTNISAINIRFYEDDFCEEANSINIEYNDPNFFDNILKFMRKE